MSRIHKVVVVIFCIIAIGSIVTMIIVLNSAKNNVDYTDFIPPEFEQNAVDGEPNVPENLGYSLMSLDDEYNIYVCGKLKNEGGKVDAYFTSDINNNVWVKLQIISGTDEVMGETGIIKPGQYVKSIKLKYVPDKETEVKLKVIGYEPETYHSGGSAEMKTKLYIS